MLANCRELVRFKLVGLQPSGFILHHPVGICITPCRRCVRTNIHQRRNYASGNTNPDVDAVFAAAVKNVQNPRICGRRQVLSAIMTLFRVYALPGTAVTNSNSQVDAVFKPLRGRCLQSPSCISSLVRRCRGVSRYRHCVGAPGRVVDSRPNNVTETPVR